MSMRILNRSFSGGEITPELFGRLDLPKVQESLALCRNFITLPHGPVVNRPGTEFVNEVQTSANATRLIPFSYNNEQTFAIELGAGYFRFHTQAATLAYTAPAAYGTSIPYNLGDMASSGGVNYYCINTATGNAPAAAAWSNTTAYTAGNTVTYGGITYACTVANTGNMPAYTSPPNQYWWPLWYALPSDLTYEIPNTYAASDLFDIHYTQSADVMTLTHPNYPITELRRYGSTNWQTNTVNFAPRIGIPAGANGAGAPNTYSYEVTVLYWVVSASGSTTIESKPSAAGSCTNDLTQAGAYNTISWTPVYASISGGLAIMPVAYLVYRQESGTYYFIGTSVGASFVDDISKTATTRTPPANSAWGTVGLPDVIPTTAATFGNVNAANTGTGTVSYSYVATAVGPDGSESYMSNVATCSNNLATSGNFNTVTVPAVAGAIRYNVYKFSNGIYGFIGQIGEGTNTFVDDNITPDVSLTPPLHQPSMSAPGDYPAAVAYYQQRRIFAGSTDQPQNVWATRSGTEADMSYTIPARDDNRLAFRIAGREASAIRHIVPMQDLLFLSASCEWKCISSTGVLTPATLNVQPQSYVGANNVQPVVVGNAVLYAAARGGHIRQMGYNWQINGYQSDDASIFAPHLFDYNTISDMAYSRGPVPILWCVSSTGKLLGMTWLPEQKIAAWHQHDTGNGDAFESVCAISENNEDMLYAIVRRTINGTSKRYVERLHTRLYASLADAHYVDCGATYNGAGSLSGAFTRSGAIMTCTVTGHGLSNGQTCWFAFSDASFGALPAGQAYAVTVVDANTFTLTVPDAGATEGTVTSTHTGAYTRDWTTITCTLAGHGLSAGQACWLAFSDAALGVAPGGSLYTAGSVADANHFTVDVPTEVSISLADPAVVTLANHGLAAGDQVIFFTTGVLPVGLTTATPYYVINPDTSSYQLALTAGGTPISSAARSAAVTISTGAPAIVTWAAHGLSAGTAVSFSTTGMLPGGLLAAGTCYVINPTTDTFQLAATPNGAAIATTSAGSGIQTCTTTQAGVHTACHVGSAAVTISDGTPAVITWNNHGLAAGAPVMFSTTGALPSGIAAGTTYYVLAVDANSFQIAATPNGAAIATTSAGSGTQTCIGSVAPASGTLTLLPNSFQGLTWLEGMTVNILADGAVLPPQTVTGGTVTFPVGVNTAHIGLPITAQIQTPPAAQAIDPALGQGLPKNINKVFLRTYRSSGILAGPDFDHLVPYHQRTTENPGSSPAMVSDEIEIVLDAAWSTSGQVCIQQSDPLPLDIAAMTLEIATGGGI